MSFLLDSLDDIGYDAPEKLNRSSGLAGDTWRDIKAGTAQLPGFLAGLADIPAAAVTGVRPYGLMGQMLSEATGVSPSRYAQEMEMQKSEAYQQGRPEIDEAWQSPDTNAFDILGAYAKNPRHVASFVAQSIPSVAAGGGLSRLVARAAPGLGGTFALSAGEGSVMAGQQMAGYDPNLPDQRRAALLSGATGVAGGAMGALGGRMAQRMGLADVDVMLAGTGREGLQDLAKRPLSFGGRVAGGTFAEGVLEEAPQSAFETAMGNLMRDLPITQDMPRNVVEGMLAGNVMGGLANLRTSRSRADWQNDINGAMETAFNTEAPFQARALSANFLEQVRAGEIGDEQAAAWRDTMQNTMQAEYTSKLLRENDGLDLLSSEQVMEERQGLAPLPPRAPTAAEQNQATMEAMAPGEQLANEYATEVARRAAEGIPRGLTEDLAARQLALQNQWREMQMPSRFGYGEIPAVDQVPTAVPAGVSNAVQAPSAAPATVGQGVGSQVPTGKVVAKKGRPRKVQVKEQVNGANGQVVRTGAEVGQAGKGEADTSTEGQAAQAETPTTAEDEVTGARLAKLEENINQLFDAAPDKSKLAEETVKAHGNKATVEGRAPLDESGVAFVARAIRQPNKQASGPFAKLFEVLREWDKRTRQATGANSADKQQKHIEAARMAVRGAEGDTYAVIPLLHAMEQEFGTKGVDSVIKELKSKGEKAGVDELSPHIRLAAAWSAFKSGTLSANEGAGSGTGKKVRGNWLEEAIDKQVKEQGGTTETKLQERIGSGKAGLLTFLQKASWTGFSPDVQAVAHLLHGIFRNTKIAAPVFEFPDETPKSEEGRDINGSFTPATKTSPPKIVLGPNASMLTVMHELLHAAVSQYIAAHPQSRAVDQLKITLTTIAKLSDKAIKDFYIAYGVAAGSVPHEAVERALRNTRTKSHNGDVTGGINELVTYGLTSPDFQQFLKAFGIDGKLGGISKDIGKTAAPLTKDEGRLVRGSAPKQRLSLWSKFTNAMSWIVTGKAYDAKGTALMDKFLSDTSWLFQDTVEANTDNDVVMSRIKETEAANAARRKQPTTLNEESSASDLAEILALLKDSPEATLGIKELTDEELDAAETLFLSDLPKGTRKYYPRGHRLAVRIRQTSDAAANDLGGKATTERVSNTPLGPFSGYRTVATIDDDGTLNVEVWGKEQIAAGLTAEPALTFNVTPKGAMIVNGPDPLKPMFKEFRKRGWAEPATAAGKEAPGWTRLVGDKDGKLPLSQVAPLIGEVHARARINKQVSHIGLHWERATGMLGHAGAALFEEAPALGAGSLGTSPNPANNWSSRGRNEDFIAKSIRALIPSMYSQDASKRTAMAAIEAYAADKYDKLKTNFPKLAKEIAKIAPYVNTTTAFAEQLGLLKLRKTSPLTPANELYTFWKNTTDVSKVSAVFNYMDHLADTEGKPTETYGLTEHEREIARKAKAAMDDVVSKAPPELASRFEGLTYGNKVTIIAKAEDTLTSGFGLKNLKNVGRSGKNITVATSAIEGFPRKAGKFYVLFKTVVTTTNGVREERQVVEQAMSRTTAEAYTLKADETLDLDRPFMYVSEGKMEGGERVHKFRPIATVESMRKDGLTAESIGSAFLNTINTLANAGAVTHFTNWMVEHPEGLAYNTVEEARAYVVGKKAAEFEKLGMSPADARAKAEATTKKVKPLQLGKNEAKQTTMVDAYRAPGEWVQVPKSKNMGALAGMIVDGPAWAAIVDATERTPMVQFELYNDMLTGWKTVKTVYNPPTVVGNFMSNFALAWMNNIPTKVVGESIKLYAKYAMHPESLTTKERAIMDAFHKSGATLGSWTTSEVRKVLTEAMLRDTQTHGVGVFSMARAALNLNQNMEAAIAQKAKQGKWAASKVHGAMVEAYAAGDNVFRLASFMSSMGDMERQGGFTNDQMLELAARKAQEEFLNYDIDAKYVKIARQTFLPFVSFTYAASKRLAVIAKEQPWKIAEVAIIYQIASAALLSLTGDSDDEDRKKRARDKKTDTTWFGGYSTVRLPTEDGKTAYLELARWLPTPISFKGGPNEFMGFLPQSLTPGGPVIDAVAAMAGVSLYTGKSIYKDTDTDVDKFYKSSVALAKMTVPSSLSRELGTTTDSMGNAPDITTRAAKWVAPVTEVNDAAAAKTQQSAIKAVTMQFDKEQGGLKRMRDTKKLTQEEYIQRVADLREARKAKLDELRNGK